MNTTTTPAVPQEAQKDTFTADTIAKQMGYGWPWKVRALIKRNLPMLRTLGPIVSHKVQVTATDGAIWEVDDYELSRAQATFIGALIPTANGTLSGSYMVELEALHHAGHLVLDDTPEAEEAFASFMSRHRERQRKAWEGAR